MGTDRWIQPEVTTPVWALMQNQKNSQKVQEQIFSSRRRKKITLDSISLELDTLMNKDTDVYVKQYKNNNIIAYFLVKLAFSSLSGINNTNV